MSSKAALLRPKRWDQPFDPAMTVDDVDRLVGLDPFSRMDPGRFPDSVPLRGVLQNDTCIRRFEEGDVVVREGEYGTSAFLILEGSVRVALERLSELSRQRTRSRKPSVFKAFVGSFRRPGFPETRKRGLNAGEGVQMRGSGRDARIFLQDIPGVLERTKTVRLQQGDLFGEMAALGRTERSATVFAEGSVVLLEIRWPGLRELRKFDPQFQRHLDGLYRERSLETQLKHTPIFEHLTDEQLAEVVQSATFETYGQFDWHLTYKDLIDRPPQERLANEPVVVQQGDYVNGVTIVRNGFGRVSRSYGSALHTVTYLSKGETFGLAEIVHNARYEENLPHQLSLRAVGYMDTLFIPAHIIERYVLGQNPQHPLVDTTLIPDIPVSEYGMIRYDEFETRVEGSILEGLVENRVVNGTATMLIDLDRCTRCDDCVRACANAHDGNPKFVRHGPQIGGFMVANACMHCADPVCMIGCPTGAIHRDVQAGRILINEDTCVGCATCANSCPYQNIRMVEIRNTAGEVLRDMESSLPILKATKCDLCIDELGGPACQRACPHDALIRIDMQKGPRPLETWLTRG